MQSVVYNHYFFKIFPFVFLSKFNCFSLNNMKVLKNAEVILTQKKKTIPEVLFWTGTKLQKNNIFKVNASIKKRYMFGESFLHKIFTGLIIKPTKTSQLIYVLFFITKFILSQQWEVPYALETKSKRFSRLFKSFKFFRLEFDDEDFFFIRKRAPSLWKTFNVILKYKGKAKHRETSLFFFQNFKLPVS